MIAAVTWIAHFLKFGLHADWMEPMPPCRTLLSMDTFDSHATDSALWLHVRGGNGRAFGVLFDRHRNRVFAHSLRLVRTQAEAEDVTAMVFLEAGRCRTRVRFVDESILGWLLVTTHNVARNQLRSGLRHQRLLRRLPPPDSVPDHSEAVLDAIDLGSTGNTVQRAFAHLNPQDQQILLLCVLEDLSMTDVSQLLRIPSGTVKSRLFRAKQHLALVLTEYNPIQPSPSAVGEST